MSTFVQWVHLTAAVVGVGGMGFMLVLLLPSLRKVSADQRDLLMKSLLGRFRWVSWSVIVLLLASGLYNVRQFYWEVAWGRAWKFLAFKISLAFVVFVISLLLTLPLRVFDRFRARRERWLWVAFAVAIGVILISAYLRRS